MTEETKTPEQEAIEWLLKEMHADHGVDSTRGIMCAQTILNHSATLLNLEFQRQTFYGSVYAAENASRTKPDTQQ